MRTALFEHDQTLQSAISAHDGFVFSRTGDGVAAAFASPRAAVDAAVDAQRSLELPVRMGIATGEAEFRDDDYFGTVLNRAARLMAAGHGGQILVADSAAGLLSGVDLLDLGPRRLRDVSIPVGVFQVRSAGLRAEFPPLRALDTAPGNVRPTTTILIGRESELDAIKTVVRSHRLVTLTGVGGVGKTRLALEVGAQVIDEFPDGAWIFELAAVTDPASVPDAVAAVLGITQQPNKTVGESVAAALEGRSRLLIFDNCEHVVDAAADLIEAILACSATVKVLATSREGLRVADEQLWPVRSLDVLGGVDSAAVTLFMQRAGAVVPGISLVEAEKDAVVEICQRVDGIPLAIELAASRLQSMTVTELRDRLDDRFRLLVGSRRGLERHQTLRHAVQWSHDLLDDTEKSLLARCSVFAGGFDHAGACAVGGLDDDLVTLDVLDALVRKSLLVADRSLGRTRFSMLETIRQFAEEQLAASGAATEARDAHARYFAGRQADILALWDSPRQRGAYDWFTTELANLRTGFRWAADQGSLDEAATIATYTAFLGLCVENYEATAWAEELIEAAEALDDPRLGFLYTMASQCWIVGRIEEAVRYSDAAQGIIGSGLDEVPFGGECWLGGPYIACGQPDRSVEWCRARLVGTRDVYGITTALLVTSLTLAGRSDDAMAAAERAVEIAEATDNPFALSTALLAYGIAWRNSDPDRAAEAMHRGLEIARETGNRFNESHLADHLATAEVQRGDALAALDHITFAIRNIHDSGNIGTFRSPLTTLAIVLDRVGLYESAATIGGFAVSPMTAAAYPQIGTMNAHLRDVLGDETYEFLTRKGEAMTTGEIAAYAYDQTDQARRKLAAT
jgi:predicted ATPase